MRNIKNNLVVAAMLGLCFHASVFATIRTVSNDPQNPAQFTTIQAAVNAAAAGDPVYVNSSSLNFKCQ
jgi:hypothetical protein